MKIHVKGEGNYSNRFWLDARNRILCWSHNQATSKEHAYNSYSYEKKMFTYVHLEVFRGVDFNRIHLKHSFGTCGQVDIRYNDVKITIYRLQQTV